MLFHSSLRKELARSFGATLVVLVTIVITMTLVRTLSQAMDDTIAKETAAPETARRRVLEDLAWAILTGKEFLFNQ